MPSCWKSRSDGVVQIMTSHVVKRMKINGWTAAGRVSMEFFVWIRRQRGNFTNQSPTTGRTWSVLEPSGFMITLAYRPWKRTGGTWILLWFWMQLGQFGYKQQKPIWLMGCQKNNNNNCRNRRVGLPERCSWEEGTHRLPEGPGISTGTEVQAPSLFLSEVPTGMNQFPTPCLYEVLNKFFF